MYQLTFPIKKEDIGKVSTELRAEIDIRSKEIDLLRKMLSMVVNECAHPGTKSGYNERDGSWRSRCPICGSSE